MPKDEGSGIMISAFQSREFGFGFADYDKDLQDKVNANRLDQLNSRYIDGNAAIAVHNTPIKQPLKENPFVRFFQYGNADRKQGYWNYSHMIVQFEDCVDVLTTKFKNKYDYLFLFDHSNGHDRMKKNSLNVNRMNVSFGGMQNTPHPSKIKQIDGYLGKNRQENDPNVITKGETNYFYFRMRDKGPFWMDAIEQARTKYSTFTKLGKKDLNKPELQILIRLKKFQQHKSGSEDIIVKGTKKELVELANKLGIDVQKETKIYTNGWLGKPKGMRQIAYERGFITKENYKEYTEYGKRDERGVVIDKSYSLRHILSSCTDFAQEKTLLQHYAKKLAKKKGIIIIIDRTPKCHPELAGEGIEYSWAVAKIFLRRVPLNKRNTQEKFLNYVRLSLSTSADRGGRLTRDKVISNSARARDYMAAYYMLNQKMERSASASCDSKDLFHSLTREDIETMNKVYRHHCEVLVSQRQYCLKMAADAILDPS